MTITPKKQAEKIVDDWRNYIIGDRQRAALISQIAKAIDNERKRAMKLVEAVKDLSRVSGRGNLAADSTRWDRVDEAIAAYEKRNEEKPLTPEERAKKVISDAFIAMSEPAYWCTAATRSLLEKYVEQAITDAVAKETKRMQAEFEDYEPNG